MVSDKSVNVYHIFSIFTERRDQLKFYLEKLGIETGIHYPIPVHKQKYYQAIENSNGSSLKVSELASSQELSLPMFPELMESELYKVIENIKLYMGSR